MNTGATYEQSIFALRKLKGTFVSQLPEGLSDRQHEDFKFHIEDTFAVGEFYIREIYENGMALAKAYHA